MQNAGHQYGQGAVSSLATPPFMHTDVAGNGGTTSSLRQFRKKDQMDKHIVESGSANLENVARVAPHNYYPSRPNDCYRYPQYSDYNIQSQVKYSEISEPQHMQHADHLNPSVQKPPKLDMCNVQPPHMKQPYADHLNGQQRYPTDPIANPSQYFHKDITHMQTPYKQESQYPQFQQKYPNIPTQSRKLPTADNDFLSKLSKINPTMARSIMSDYHMREPQHSSYPTLDQSRMYHQQNQRYYPTAMQSNSYYNYNYPASCSYKPPDYTGSTQMPMSRYPTINPHVDRSISPRRGYPDNLSMGMNYSSMPPQKIPSAYSQCSAPEYAQHYQHRRTVTHQEYYSHYNRSSQFITNHQISPEIPESPRTVSNNLKQYIENWADEETATEMAQTETSRGHTAAREEANSAEPQAVYMINAYLENGMSIENGQYIIKNIMDGPGNSGVVRIIEAGKEKTELENNVVNVHIVEAPKSDCMITEKLQTEISVTEVNCLQTESRNSKVVIHSNAIIQPPIISNASDQVQESVIKTLEQVTKRDDYTSELPTMAKVDKNCSPINMDQLDKTIDLTLDEKPKDDLQLAEDLTNINTKNEADEAKIKNELEEISKSNQQLNQPVEISDLNNPKPEHPILQDNESEEKPNDQELPLNDDNVKDLSLKHDENKDSNIDTDEGSTLIETEAKDLTTKAIKHMPVIEDCIECDSKSSTSSSSLTTSSSEDEDSNSKDGAEAEENKLCPINVQRKNEKITECDSNKNKNQNKSSETEEEIKNQEITEANLVSSKENPIVEKIICSAGIDEEKKILKEAEPEKIQNKTVDFELDEHFTHCYRRTRRIFSVDDIIGNTISREREQRRNSLESLQMFLNKEKECCEEYVKDNQKMSEAKDCNTLDLTIKDLKKVKDHIESEINFKQSDSVSKEIKKINNSEERTKTESEDAEMVEKNQVEEINSDSRKDLCADSNLEDLGEPSEENVSKENTYKENAFKKDTFKEDAFKEDVLKEDTSKDILNEDNSKEDIFKDVLKEDTSKDVLNEDNSKEDAFKEDTSKENTFKETPDNEITEDQSNGKICPNEKELLQTCPILNKKNDDNNNEKEMNELNHEVEEKIPNLENRDDTNILNCNETEDNEKNEFQEETHKNVEVELEKLNVADDNQENLEYRNVIKVDDNSVLLHIAGELVEINVTLVNGKKLITVVPLSSDSMCGCEESEKETIDCNESQFLAEDSITESNNLALTEEEDNQKEESKYDEKGIETTTLDQNENITNTADTLEKPEKLICREDDTLLIPEVDSSNVPIDDNENQETNQTDSKIDAKAEIIESKDSEVDSTTNTNVQEAVEEAAAQSPKEVDLKDNEEDIPIIDAEISIGEADLLETGTEVTVGNDSIDEEIQLDLTPSEKIFFCTKAAKKAYDSSLLLHSTKEIEKEISSKENNDISRVIKKETKDKSFKNKLKCSSPETKVPQNTHFTRSTIRKQMEIFNEIQKESKRSSVSDEDHEEFVDFRKRLRARKLKKMKNKKLLKNNAQNNGANKSGSVQEKPINNTKNKNKEANTTKPPPVLTHFDEVNDKKRKPAETNPIINEIKNNLKKFKIPKRDDSKDEASGIKNDEKPPKLVKEVESVKPAEKEKICTNTKINELKHPKNIVHSEKSKINEQIEKSNGMEVVKERIVKHVSFSNKVNYSSERNQVLEQKQQISPILKNKNMMVPAKTNFTFSNNNSPTADQRKRLSLQEYNSRKRKPSSGNEDYPDNQPVKKSKIEPRIETPPTPTDPDEIINWQKLNANIELPKLVLKETKPIPPTLDLMEARLSRDPRLKRKLSLEETKNKRMSDWEEPQSPTSLPTPTLEKPDDSILEIGNLLNLNRKSKVLIDINDLTPTPSHSSQSSEDDMLQIYREQVDSKLSSLSIQIPKPKTKQFTPDIPPESQILMRKFLSNQQLTPGEVQKVKEIIKFKRIMEYLKTKENSSDMTSPTYEIRKQCLDTEEADFKLHLKKVPELKDKVKKRSLNLSDSSSDSEFDSDFSGGNVNSKSSANYSVVQTSTFASGVPKLIIKRSRNAIHQPIVRLERLDIEAVDRKSFY